MRRRVLVVIALLAGFAVFCAVQDRITAAGARRYVALQRDAAAGRGAAVTVEEIMQPVIDRSVRAGLAWGGGVAAAGVAVALIAGRR